MYIIGIIGIVIILFLILIFRGETDIDKGKKGLMSAFDKAATGLYRLILRDSDLSVTTYRKLLPERNSMEEAKKYTIEKLSQSLLFMLVGCIVMLLTGLVADKDSSLIQNQMFVRPGYAEDSMETSLIAITGEGSEEVDITVQARKYDEATFNRISEKYLPVITDDILSENQDLSQICHHLNFNVEFPENYPFDILVESLNRTFISPEGELQPEIPREGISGELKIEISYEEYVYERKIPIVIYPLELSEREAFLVSLSDKVKEAEGNHREAEQFRLPDTIGDTRVQWKEKKHYKKVLPGVLIIIVGAANFFLRNVDTKKKIQKREGQLKEDYALIISKLGVFLGAGVPVKEAFRKMVFDYDTSKKGKRAAYEEMAMVVREMESGVAEIKAYETFGKRCGSKEYIKFGMLLSSHCKKGNAGMLRELKKEEERAWEESKADARKRGEEAGTKLLFPMLLFLLIVMIVIMIPAFSSFTL